VLLTLTAVGLAHATKLVAREDLAVESSLFRTFALAFLVLGLSSTAHLCAFYGASAGEMARRELDMASWIRQNLEPGARIANAATSVEFLTGHRSVNLHGVTTAAFAGNRTAEREAGTFESLSRLQEDERPEYLLTAASLQRGSALLRELAPEPPLHATRSLGDDLLLFRLDRELPGRQHSRHAPKSGEAVAGLLEVDRLNVCDLRDEAAHGYAFASALGDLGLWGTVKIADYAAASGPLRVADGGRAIFGHEAFRVSTRSGRDLVVVMRTSAAVEAAVLRASASSLQALQIPEARLTLLASGQAAGHLLFRPEAGWTEIAFKVPAAAVGDGQTELRLEGRYASFHYWFYQ
jgi:hypothetical protein